MESKAKLFTKEKTYLVQIYKYSCIYYTNISVYAIQIYSYQEYLHLRTHTHDYSRTQAPTYAHIANLQGKNTQLNYNHINVYPHQCLPTSMFTNTNVCPHQCLPTPVFTHTNVYPHHCLPTPMFTHTNVYPHQCLPTPMFTHTNVYHPHIFLPQIPRLFPSIIKGQLTFPNTPKYFIGMRIIYKISLYIHK